MFPRSNATVEELAKIACKHMRMKIFGESTQKTQGETDTQQQQSSSMPDVILPQIGDYLLTLPQQLEPFISQDNAAVMTALKLGQLPHAGTLCSLLFQSLSLFLRKW